MVINGQFWFSNGGQARFLLMMVHDFKTVCKELTMIAAGEANSWLIATGTKNPASNATIHSLMFRHFGIREPRRGNNHAAWVRMATGSR